MRLRVIVFALVATAVAVGLVAPLAGAKPKPPKPPKPPKSTTTVAPTTTTVAPTTTMVAPTTTVDPTIHLTGSRTFPTDGEPRPIYVVDPADAEILGARSCPSGSILDYDASTIVVPADVELINQLDSTGSIIVWLPYIERDPIFGDLDERTVTYDFVCVPT
jgi:hypothetical protein